MALRMTPERIQALRDVNAGKVHGSEVGVGAFYKATGRLASALLRPLREAGYVKLPHDVGGRFSVRRFELTDEGRAVLNAAEAKAKVASGRATCPVCGRDITVTRAGTIRRHGAAGKNWPPQDCAGYGQTPKEG